jgi:hypothetical protein
VLRHTTEEVHAACIDAIEPERVKITSRLRDQVMKELGQALSKHDWFAGFDITDEQPIKYSLQQWINHVKEAEAVVFIAGIVSRETYVVMLLCAPMFVLLCSCIYGLCHNFPHTWNVKFATSNFNVQSEKYNGRGYPLS